MKGKRWGAACAVMFGTSAAGCASTPAYPQPGMSAWTEATTEHFVVQAEAPEHEAAEAARRLEWAYDGYAKVAFAGLPAPPRLNVRLFRDETRFDAFVGTGQTYYLSLEEGLDINDQPLLVSYVFPRLQGPRAPKVQMGLAAFLTAHYYPSAPPWLRAGLAQFYQTAGINWGEFSLGAAPDRFWYDGPNAVARASLRGGGAFTFTRAELPRPSALLALDPIHYFDSEQSGPSKVRVLNLAASWALVHTLAMPGSPWRERFRAYLSALRRREGPEAAWREHFGSPEVQRALDEAFEAELRQPEITRAFLPYDPAGTAETRTRPLSEYEAHVLLAQSSMLRATNDAQAREHLEAAIAAAPSSPEPYFLRSAFLVRQGRQDEALADKRRAVASSGGDALYQLSFAAHLLWIEHCRDATGAPSAELKGLADALRPPSGQVADFHLWSARYEALWGSPERALAHAQRAAQLEPPCSDCFEIAAAALLRQGGRKAAISSQREALRRTHAPAAYERRLAWLKVLEGATSDTPASALSLPLPRACPLAPEAAAERAP